MDLGLGNTLLAGDPCLVDHIVGEVKSQGIFDQFRKECIADVDTKPAYQNLRTRVESSVNSFLSKQVWRADLNKNQLRETLRKHIHDAPYLDAGVERIVDQVVNPKVYSVFMPQIEDVVYKFLGLERPKTSRDRNGACRLKDLLPKDLDPVSPESDKNSLKDVSLDSVDANLVVSVPRKTEEAAVAEDGRSKGKGKERVSEEEKEEAMAEKEEQEGGQEEVVSTKATSTAADQSLNCSAKSEDKTEEEEEDSPTFEPIDIMNLNESNVSNDSHLSGISELTSHRSRSPDFSNETSRDNMDFSNQDSQLSKVSSDSRLSIVTDFGSSNHASTPLSDAPKDERDKPEAKYGRENFRAVREFEASSAGSSSSSRSKETTVRASQEASRDEGRSARRSASTKETSLREAADASAKETREKSREVDSSKSKSSRETKRDKGGDSSRRSEPKSDKLKRTKERPESSRDSADKPRDPAAKLKEPRDPERKENLGGKESKDLKDMYKEKIRELRERKELTEKEKLGGREARSGSKDTREKGDSSREVKKDSRDSSKSASSRARTSHTDGKTARSEGKASRSESRGKRGEEGKRGKDQATRNSHGGSDSGDKFDPKRSARTEKDEKSEKSETRRESDGRRRTSAGKSSRSDSSKNSESGKRDSKAEADKKRREEKKSKVKDDHSSLRRNPDDRRSTDRDGSNGSNGRTSQKNNSGAPSASKSVASSLPKESATPSSSNSSGETSDSVEEKQTEGSGISPDSKKPEVAKISGAPAESSNDEEFTHVTFEKGRDEASLPIKKRSLGNESTEAFAKKPKFAKNFQEAKRLMKIRRRMERDESRRRVESEKSEKCAEIVETGRTIVKDDELPPVPDEERVQIIEVRDEEYDEPYPEVRSEFTLEERSRIILGGESIFTSELIAKPFDATTYLSQMETSIRQSLEEMISDNRLDETKERATKPGVSLDRENEKRLAESTVLLESYRLNLLGTGNPSENRNFPIASRESGNSRSQTEVTDIRDVRVEGKAADEEIETRFERSETLENAEPTSAEANVEETTNAKEIHPNVEPIPEETSRVQGKIKESESEKRACEVAKDVEEPRKVDTNVEGRAKAREVGEKKREIDEMVEEEPETGESLEGGAKAEILLGEKTKLGVRASSKDEKTSATRKMIAPRILVSPEKMSPSEDKNKPETKNFGGPMDEESASCLSEDEAPCLYFVRDNERLERFSRFMKSLESGESSGEEHQPEIVVSSLSKSMAPPKPKRKYSTSPLTDILLNNANNNNDAHNIEPVSDHEDTGNSLKKRKIGRPKKQKNNASLCSQQQSLSNGENFVMPLSPESDVSATSEKAPTNSLKDEKSRPRGSNQRYASDDLYKPRPLFSSSSRRSRRSNQA